MVLKSKCLTPDNEIASLSSYSDQLSVAGSRVDTVDTVGQQPGPANADNRWLLGAALEHKRFTCTNSESILVPLNLK